MRERSFFVETASHMLERADCVRARSGASSGMPVLYIDLFVSDIARPCAGAASSISLSTCAGTATLGNVYLAFKG